jgi:hypothetical protein
MLIIPTAPVPSQELSVQLSGQDCRIALYKKTTGMFCDVWVSDFLIIGGVLCLDRNRIVRDAYLGFIGDLAMTDTQGTDDPETAGLGSRWLLTYLEPADLLE